MKIFSKSNVLITLVIGLAFFVASCSKDGFTPYDPTPYVNPEPKVTGTGYLEDYQLKIYNFEYPSSDPYGRPVTLSGAITVGDEVTDETPAVGTVVINHFTTYRRDQCPSKGDLMIQKIVSGTGLVAVSPDLYGFGSAEAYHQAYCMGKTNAQAGIDALLSARKLFPELGISFAEGKESQLFNLGYSQGGQTTIALLKLVTEKYPDINITHSFAGAGPYSIPDTYRSFIESGQTGMPSTVVSVLLAYDEFFKLGISRSDMFKSPVLENIDSWFLSKDYSSSQIDEFIGSLTLPDITTADMMDINSDISRKFMAVFDTENLCKGWAPKQGERINMVYHEKDTTVPPVNSTMLYDYLVNTLHMENVSLKGASVSDLIPASVSRHEAGAIDFAYDVVGTLDTEYGISAWAGLTKLIQEYIK